MFAYDCSYFEPIKPKTSLFSKVGKTVKKGCLYAALGAAYGAAAVALFSPVGAVTATALGIGAAIGAGTLALGRAISKDLGHVLAVAPPLALAGYAGAYLLGFGHPGMGLCAGLFALGLASMFDTQPTPLSPFAAGRPFTQRMLQDHRERMTRSCSGCASTQCYKRRLGL